MKHKLKLADTAPPPNKEATLAIDIGGTGVKASVLDSAGTMLVDRVRVVCSVQDDTIAFDVILPPLAVTAVTLTFAGQNRG